MNLTRNIRLQRRRGMIMMRRRNRENDDDDDDDENDNVEDEEMEEEVDDDRYAESVITIGSGNFGSRNDRPYADGLRLRARDHRANAAAHRAGGESTADAAGTGRWKCSRRPLHDGVSHDNEMDMYASAPPPSSMAASSYRHDQRPTYGKPALEWDLFLDPTLVRSVDAALGIVEELDVKLRKARMKRERRRRASASASHAASSPKSFGNNRDVNPSYCVVDEDDDYDDFDLSQSHTAANVEVDRLVSQLVRRTVIAHGSMSQLVLEAMGVAQRYNYRTVVKSSRDGSAGGGGGGGNGAARGPLTPSRYSSSASHSWDAEVERRDFEALLDPTMLGENGGAGGRGGSRSSADKGGTRRSAGGSKGMFIETWLHIFARALSLLSKSTNEGSIAAPPDETNAGDGRDPRLVVVENRPADIGQRVLSGLLEKIFLRRDSSVYSQRLGIFPPEAVADECDECRTGDVDNLDEGATDFRDDDSELLTNDDMFSPAPSPTASSAFGNMCGVSLCFGGCLGGSSKSTFPTNPHASHKMAQDIERISAVLGEPLRLVLDLKSRRVPPRVWCRLIDSLRTRGLVIEGIGSFDMDESRLIGRGCSCPLNPILFFHSVGDLQRACHANEVSAFVLGRYRCFARTQSPSLSRHTKRTTLFRTKL